MDIARGLVAVAAASLIACSGDGLQGPERLTFEDVEQLDVRVDRGGATVFGVEDPEEVTVHRWWNDEDDFEYLEETLEDGRLNLGAVCRGGTDCRARYETSVDTWTPTSVEVDQGHLDVFKLERPLEATLGAGELTATGLRVPSMEVEIGEGTAEIEMLEPPRFLGLQLGPEAEAEVVVPDQPYRCAFDDESETIEADGLECDRSVGDAIEIQPDDARVDFVLGDRPD